MPLSSTNADITIRYNRNLVTFSTKSHVSLSGFRSVRSLHTSVRLVLSAQVRQKRLRAIDHYNCQWLPAMLADRCVSAAARPLSHEEAGRWCRVQQPMNIGGHPERFLERTHLPINHLLLIKHTHLHLLPIGIISN